MSLNPRCYALSQISFLVNTINKKNYKASCAEIGSLVDKHGPTADFHLFRCLISHVEFTDTKSNKEGQQLQLLMQETVSLVTKPNFTTILCYAFEGQEPKHLKASAQLLPNLSKYLRLTVVQEVVFAVGLMQSSDPDLKLHSSNFLKSKLPELVRSHIEADPHVANESGLNDVPTEILHVLLLYLLQKTPEETGISSESLTTFLDAIRRDFPRERVPVVLAPLLYQNQLDITEERQVMVPQTSPEISVELSDIIKELGYTATATQESIEELLANLGVVGLTASHVAKILGMMAATHTGLSESFPLQVTSNAEILQEPAVKPTTWNVKNFVLAVKKKVPALSMRDVILAMDYPEFFLHDVEGLKIILSAYHNAVNVGAPFPVDALYTEWKNPMGQLSWIRQGLHCQEFSFTQFPGSRKIELGSFMSHPDEESKYISTWMSLDLVETLLNIAETGNFDEVLQLFSGPLKQCPEILFFGLLQAKPNGSTMQKELLSWLMPFFITNHPASSNILAYAWRSHYLETQQLVMAAIADWYKKSETPMEQSQKLSKIVDIAHDLKCLMLMLKATQFPFVIDLACLAARRDYLKLDMWVSERIKSHQEPFVVACINFLVKKDHDPRPNLTRENIVIILACLQPYTGVLSAGWSGKLQALIEVHAPIPKLQPMGGPVKPSDAADPTSFGMINTPSDQPHGGAFTPLDTGVGVPSSFTTVPGAIGEGMSSAIGTSPAKNSYGFGMPMPMQAQGLFPGPTDSGRSFMAPGPGQDTPIGMMPGAPPMGLQKPATLPIRQPVGQQNLPIGFGMTKETPKDSLSFGMEMDQQQQPQQSQPQQQQQQPQQLASDETHQFFEALYSGYMTVDKLLEILKQFRSSTIQKEKELFTSMVRRMFEEYKYFPGFPEKELRITGQLFGGIIDQGLVPYMMFKIGLKCVLEALKKPPSNRMFMFGIAALDKFKGKLKDWPEYCGEITNIPHFSQFPLHLQQCVQYGQQLLLNMDGTPSGASFRPFSQTSAAAAASIGSSLTASLQQQQQQQPRSPVASPTSSTPQSPQLSPTPRTPRSGSSTPPHSGQKPPAGSPGAAKREQPPSIATATNIDTLLVAADKEESEKEPTEAMQDKTHFIFNNLSASNLQQKVEEFKDVVDQEYFGWVAQYLVMKRVSIEPNFHSLYMNFLDALNEKQLFVVVLKETHRNIKVILRTDKSVNSYSDRSILKNLGRWLGMQTLAKNKPVFHEDIAVKDIIIEAYHKGQQDLLYVVPFVAKILESCAESRVFKPPNPWVMGIMSLLSELHAVPDVKLNLKFEVEVLCKHLSLDLKELQPSNLLKSDHLPAGPSQLSAIKPPLSPSQPLPTTPPTVTNTPIVTEEGQSQGRNQPSPAPPPQPRFHFDDINITSIAGLSQHIQVNPQIVLLQQFPQLKQMVRPAIEKAVQDLLAPVVERSIKIALTTAENIVKKDFALDPDETRMRIAAHHIVRNLTAGMAMITSREPLLLAISANLKASMSNVMRSPSEDQKTLVDQACQQLTADNTELASAFIQKTAVEKAVSEMDKRMTTDYELRKVARSEGRRYCDPTVLTYQAERMPEQLRLKVGGASLQHSAVYEEFAICLPGFLPSAPSLSAAGAKEGGFMRLEFVPTEEFLLLLDKCIREINQHLRSTLAPPNNMHVMKMNSLLELVMQLRITQSQLTALNLLQRGLEGLLEGMNSPPTDPELFVRFRDVHLLVLRLLQEPRALGPQAACRHVTRMLLECRDELKFTPRALILLIGTQLVEIKELDVFLCKSIETGRNFAALSCTIKLVTALISAEKRDTPITDANNDLKKTKEMLTRLVANMRHLPESSAQLLEQFRIEHGIRPPSFMSAAPGSGSSLGMLAAAEGMGELDKAPGGPTSVLHHGLMMQHDYDDPPGLYEKVEYMLSEWVRYYHQPGMFKEGDKIYAAYVARLQQQGIFKSEDLLSRFFRISIEMCVELCYRTLNDPSINPTLARAKCYHTMDAFVRLVVVLVRFSGESTNNVTKINLVNKVLGTVAHVLVQDHEVHTTEFHQLPYHRFFIMLLTDLTTSDPVFEAIIFPVLQAFGSTYLLLKPSRAPGFAYSWLELVSHRIFITKLLLQTPQKKGWPMFQQLLISLFKFLAPFLRNAELSKPTHLLYKGTLRVLLVLLHDFPEFLCDYHFAFCDVIPPNCIQMRNLILSAFPRNMRLPDPFTPSLKVEMLPDIAHAPRIVSNYESIIPENLKKDLNEYIKSRSPVTFLSELRSKLQISTDPGNQYNVSLINALVLFVGTQAIAYIHSKGSTPSASTIAYTAHMDIFQHLLVDLDTEGRYLFLNAIANQLRYPNSHTHYFSCALLSLFAEANTEAIQEQITRVLLERLIVNRPHPWGLLITFIDLIKNPTYKFWNHEFVHCAPEIEKLFESVARSCMQKQTGSQAAMTREQHETTAAT
ncbi:CCR4-NOT transcription complex subunit 1-like isoform X2 [Dysidea avara]|uniref:CCR4-NOT transcription complex subunit 1-like isoform X2 n=1 Tax=Dysidea avara TaxID=196820 RepID=UPI00332AD974